MRRTLQIRRHFAWITVLILAGCASNAVAPGIRETLDPLTGVTVTSSLRPLIMYRDNSGRAAYAKSYLHVGPVQVNRSGNYEYYLWVAGWSTMQSGNSLDDPQSLDSIVIFADGEPLLLDLAGRTPATIGTSEPVYLKPVASAIEGYYRVTADQIRLIAQAGDILLRTSESNPLEYTLWDDQRGARRDLRAFVDSTFF
jgi:hypothetical protein